MKFLQRALMSRDDKRATSRVWRDTPTSMPSSIYRTRGTLYRRTLTSILVHVTCANEANSLQRASSAARDAEVTISINVIIIIEQTYKASKTGSVA